MKLMVPPKHKLIEVINKYIVPDMVNKNPEIFGVRKIPVEKAAS
jgi:hypothetical protein